MAVKVPHRQRGDASIAKDAPRPDARDATIPDARERALEALMSAAMGRGWFAHATVAWARTLGAPFDAMEEEGTAFWDALDVTQLERLVASFDASLRAPALPRDAPPAERVRALARRVVAEVQQKWAFHLQYGGVRGDTPMHPDLVEIIACARALYATVSPFSAPIAQIRDAAGALSPHLDLWADELDAAVVDLAAATAEPQSGPRLRFNAVGHLEDNGVLVPPHTGARRKKPAPLSGLARAIAEEAIKCGFSLGGVIAVPLGQTRQAGASAARLVVSTYPGHFAGKGQRVDLKG